MRSGARGQEAVNAAGEEPPASPDWANLALSPPRSVPSRKSGWDRLAFSPALSARRGSNLPRVGRRDAEPAAAPPPPPPGVLPSPAMYLCRVAWQALASRLTRAAPVLRGHAPFRQMSSGSVPGSSGENVIYYLLVVGATTAGGFYAYRTITSDKARYNERVEDIQQRSTAEWKPKPWPPASSENEEIDAKEEVAEGSEETKDVIQKGAEEAETEEEAEAVPADNAEVQNKTQSESTEEEKGEDSATEAASSGTQEEQGAASTSETDETQGLPDVLQRFMASFQNRFERNMGFRMEQCYKLELKKNLTSCSLCKPRFTNLL